MFNIKKTKLQTFRYIKALKCVVYTRLFPSYRTGVAAGNIWTCIYVPLGRANVLYTKI